MGDDGYRAARFADLDTTTLYALLRLRVEVFVVEQECAFQELDGRDIDPATLHLWVGDPAGAPVAYLRLLSEPDGLHIGRVVTARHARGRGLGGRLMRAALERAAGRPVRLAAQTHATGFYARLGFAVEGEEFLDDGIPHVAMVRPADAPVIPPG